MTYYTNKRKFMQYRKGELFMANPERDELGYESDIWKEISEEEYLAATAEKEEMEKTVPLTERNYFPRVACTNCDFTRLISVPKGIPLSDQECLACAQFTLKEVESVVV